MSEHGFNPELKQGTKVEKSREDRESPRRVGAEAAKAVISWSEVLLGKKPETKSLLSLARRQGAAVVPALLFTASMGCTELQRIHCGPDDTEYIQATIDWMTDHPEDIQASMDKLWPDQHIDAYQLVDALNDAEIFCGQPRSADDQKVGAETFKARQQIVVDVDRETYKSLVDVFKQEKWVADSYSLGSLLKVAPVDQDPSSLAAYSEYLRAIAGNAEVLGHEAAHIATNKDHTHEVKKQVAAETHDMSTTQPADEIYAWGGAAKLAAQAEQSTAMTAAQTADLASGGE